MSCRPIASPTQFGKWCAYALVLLAPGSFVILAVFWLVRLLGLRLRARGPSYGSRVAVFQQSAVDQARRLMRASWISVAMADIRAHISDQEY